MARRTTAYNLIAENLRDRILSGDLQPGEQLPPERALCEDFGASRITIRRAVQILEEESLVRRSQGRGTFVIASPSRKIPILAEEFAASVARHAPEMTRLLDAWKWQAADADVATRLNTCSGDRVLFTRRFDMLGEKPVAMDEVWMLGRYADRLVEDDLARLDFVERWQHVQRIEFSYSAQSVEAVPAAAPITEFLRVAPGEPLLKEMEIIHLSSEQPVALFVSHYRHEYFRLIATVRLMIRR